LPAAAVDGFKVPFMAPPPGAAQDPPAEGLPPRALNKAEGASEEQTVSDPSAPGFAAGTVVTVTVAMASGHGGVPVMV
jgi:hypothetical protein